MGDVAHARQATQSNSAEIRNRLARKCNGQHKRQALTGGGLASNSDGERLGNARAREDGGPIADVSF